MDRPSDIHALDERELAAHANFLRRVARRLVRDEQRAEDVAQETWRVALAKPPEQVRSWRGWLGAAAANVARQFARQSRRRDFREQSTAARGAMPSAADVAARLETERRLIDAVAALDEGDRALVLLRHFDGLAPREIARRMKLPVETVKTRLKRALERLRARLVERGGDRERLHSGLLLIANGLVAKVGAAGGVLAGGIVLSAKGKLVVALAAVAAIAVCVKLTVPTHRATNDVSRFAGDAASALGDGARRTDAEQTKTSSTASADRVEDAIPTAPSKPDDPASTTVITGRFVDVDGRPIADVEVHCPDDRDHWWPPRRAHESTWPATRSDVNGRFTWRRPSAESMPEAAKAWGSSAAPGGWADALVVHVDACRGGFVRMSFDVTGQLEAPIDVGELLMEREGRLAGRVELPAGFADARALVAATPVRAPNEPVDPQFDEPKDILLRTESGAEGRFELAGLPAGVYRLWTALPQGPYAPTKPRSLAAGQVIDDLVLRAEAPCAPTEMASIDVERPDGTPLPGAIVSVGFRRRAGTGAISTTADAKGHAEVPVRDMTITSVYASDPDHRLRPAERQVESGVENPCVLRLGESFRLEVHVRAPSQIPFDYAEVLAKTGATPSRDSIDQTDQFSANTHCGSDGACELWVPDRPVVLTARAWGFKAATVGPMKAREQVGPIELCLEAAPALTGRVVCTGVPVAGASLTIMLAGREGEWVVTNGVPSIGSFSGSYADERTDALGRFRVVADQDHGRIFLRAHAVGFAPAEIGPIEIQPDTQQEGLEIELTRGGAIAGRVLPGSDGTLAPYVVISNGDGLPRSWRIAEDGTFNVDHLTPGRFNVRVNDAPIPLLSFSFEGEQHTSFGDLPWNCVVRDGETTTLTISSDDTLACIVRGTIEGLGAEASNWRAALVSRSQPESGLRNEWIKRGQVGADGHFEVRRGLPGPCRLVLWPAAVESGAAGVSASFGLPLDVAQGVREWRGAIALGRLEVDASAVASGRPLWIDVTATTPDGLEFHSSVRSDASGHFVVPFALAGEARVRIDSLGIEQSVTVSAGETVTLQLR